MLKVACTKNLGIKKSSKYNSFLPSLIVARRSIFISDLLPHYSLFGIHYCLSPGFPKNIACEARCNLAPHILLSFDVYPPAFLTLRYYRSLSSKTLWTWIPNSPGFPKNIAWEARCNLAPHILLRFDVYPPACLTLRYYRSLSSKTLGTRESKSPGFPKNIACEARCNLAPSHLATLWSISPGISHSSILS